MRTSDNKRQRRPWNSKRSLSVASAYELFGFFYELELKWFWRQKETRETGRGRGLLWLVLSVSTVIPASFFSTSTLLNPRPDSLLLLSQHPLLQCDWRISYLFSCWVIVFVPLALRWNICVFPSLSPSFCKSLLFQLYPIVLPVGSCTCGGKKKKKKSGCRNKSGQ